jgi:leucyl-tRNA synthetase
MWQILGHDNTIAYEPWPVYDEEKCKDAEIDIAVQINGKVRSVITVAADADEKAIEEQALADSKVQAAMAGMKVVKAIVIKKKIVNFVVKPE